jgi:hypothetical protein
LQGPADFRTSTFTFPLLLHICLLFCSVLLYRRPVDPDDDMWTEDLRIKSLGYALHPACTPMHFRRPLHSSSQLHTCLHPGHVRIRTPCTHPSHNSPLVAPLLSSALPMTSCTTLPGLVYHLDVHTFVLICMSHHCTPTHHSICLLAHLCRTMCPCTSDHFLCNPVTRVTPGTRRIIIPTLRSIMRSA